MDSAELGSGIRLVDDEVDLDGPVEEDGRDRDAPVPDGALEDLRDAFVEAFNARDLDAVLGIVANDVECPDMTGDGAADLGRALEEIWQRSPGALLTRGLLDGIPVAVAWLPDEESCWSRAALVTFDTDNELLSLVALPDDPDALDRAEADDPVGDELEEWADWAEWDRGEETVPQDRDRPRP